MEMAVDSVDSSDDVCCCSELRTYENKISNEGSKESHQNKKGNKQINGGGC